jgi:SAM-dependent methyltransferase
METVSCNYCASSEYSIVYQLHDLLLDRQDSKATFVKCARCGLLYQNPRPTPAEMETHYPPEYESYTHTINRKELSLLQRKVYQYGIDKRSRYVLNHKSRGHLLDVGCSTGLFLHGMQQYSNWELTGVEINPFAAEIAQKQHNLDIHVGTLEQAQFSDKSFDAITLWDVFEHLHNPSGSLIEIHRVLKDDGILIVRVPNLDSWDAKLFGRYWAGLDAPRHLYVFNRDLLTKIFDKCGFRVKEMDSNIGSYPTFVLSLRFWMVAKSVQSNLADKTINILYHPIARLITSPLFYIYGFGSRGPLIVATAVKSKIGIDARDTS